MNMAINWDWYLKNACILLEGDDKQFDYILGRLKSNLGNKYIELEKDSPDYLFAKYRFRVISIAYVKVALILAHKDNSINADEFDDWNTNLTLLAINGNPNEHFTIPSKSIEYIGSENLKEPVERYGKKEMQSFISDSVKVVTLHLSTVSEKGGGRHAEVGQALINLYLNCFESFIDGEFDELDDFKLFISWVSLQFRGQTNFAKDLIRAYQNEESIHGEPEDEEPEDEEPEYEEPEDEELEDEELEDEELEEETEYSQEELDEISAILVSGGEDQLAELESMTKAEIKEWADVYEFNVPLSLRKAEMIERFVEEADEYVGSAQESPTSITFYILCIIGGLLLGAFVLAPLLEYFLY